MEKGGQSDHLGPWICTEEPARSSFRRGRFELTLEGKEGAHTGDAQDRKDRVYQGIRWGRAAEDGSRERFSMASGEAGHRGWSRLQSQKPDPKGFVYCAKCFGIYPKGTLEFTLK